MSLATATPGVSPSLPRAQVYRLAAAILRAVQVRGLPCEFAPADAAEFGGMHCSVTGLILRRELPALNTLLEPRGCVVVLYHAPLACRSRYIPGRAYVEAIP